MDASHPCKREVFLIRPIRGPVLSSTGMSCSVHVKMVLHLQNKVYTFSMPDCIPRNLSKQLYLASIYNYVHKGIKEVVICVHSQNDKI